MGGLLECISLGGEYFPAGGSARALPDWVPRSLYLFPRSGSSVASEDRIDCVKESFTFDGLQYVVQYFFSSSSSLLSEGCCGNSL